MQINGEIQLREKLNLEPLIIGYDFESEMEVEEFVLASIDAIMGNLVCRKVKFAERQWPVSGVDNKLVSCGMVDIYAEDTLGEIWLIEVKKNNKGRSDARNAILSGFGQLLCYKERMNDIRAYKKLPIKKINTILICTRQNDEAMMVVKKYGDGMIVAILTKDSINRYDGRKTD